MRNTKRAALTLALALALLATAAQAGVKAFKLEPMNPSMEVDGIVKMTTKGSLQKLDLRVFAGELKEGTMLLVSIVRADDGGRIDVARIELVLGSALLQLSSRKDVSPVFPFKGLLEVYVSAPGLGDLAHGVVPGPGLHN